MLLDRLASCAEVSEKNWHYSGQIPLTSITHCFNVYSRMIGKRLPEGKALHRRNTQSEGYEIRKGHDGSASAYGGVRQGVCAGKIELFEVGHSTEALQNVLQSKLLVKFGGRVSGVRKG
jgi:hypothetical protein